MGQLINPLSFRLNKNKFWIIKWSTFINKSFKYMLKDDYIIFSFLNFLFYRLKKLMKKKYFFLIVDFFILKKTNLYIFSLDYIFLNKFYKKYFKILKFNKKFKIKKFKIKKFKNLKPISSNYITNLIYFFNFFKSKFYLKLKKLKKINLKNKLNKFYKIKIIKNLRRIKNKINKNHKKKKKLKIFLKKKKSLLIIRNFIKKIFILFFIKKLKLNLIFLIISFFIIYKNKLNNSFINNPLFIFKFIKSFLILNIKKFLKNNLDLKLIPNIIIKLKNIENFTNINFSKKKIFNLFNKKELIKSNTLNLKYNNSYIFKKNFLELKKLRIKKLIKSKKKLKKKKKKKNIKLDNKFFIFLPKIVRYKKKKFTFHFKKHNLNIYNKLKFFNNCGKFINSIFNLKKTLKLKNIASNGRKLEKNKKNFFYKNFYKKKKFKFPFLNFNLKIFSLIIKICIKKYRYNINKIIKILENYLNLFIKYKSFIKGFKIKIKGRFTQKTRSSLLIKKLGKCSLSKITNKIIYFEESISNYQGLSSIKLFFLTNNNYFIKKNNLSLKIYNKF